MYSNDPEIPHETGLNGANGRSITVFTKGGVHRRRPDLDRGGCADRDFSDPARRTAPAEGETDPSVPSLFPQPYSDKLHLFPPTMKAGVVAPS